MQQIQTLQSTLGMLASPLQQPSAVLVRNVKVPEGRYNMSLSEFRTYSKDCEDYKTLTKYNDNQIILQMRLTMDVDLKRSIDTNYPDWGDKTVEDAITCVGEIVNQISNPAIYCKSFDNMVQGEKETICEYATCLHGCAMDCSFICPFDDGHHLTDHHIIKRIRSGIHDPQLQQELLQNHTKLNSVTNIMEYCEDFEAAKRDREKLSDKPKTQVGSIQTSSALHGLSEDEVIAAVSAYTHLFFIRKSFIRK